MQFRRLGLKTPTHNHIHRSGRIGAFLAIGCHIHWALTPLALTVLPLSGSSIFASHTAEFIMLGLGIAFGGYSVTKGLFNHGDRRPLWLVISGTIVILCGLFVVGEALEPFFVPIGAVLLGIGQIVNMRISRPCNHEPEITEAVSA